MADQTEPAVLVEHNAGVAWITLNRPQAMNAINDDLRALLLGTEDRKEAGRAFREKRKPEFKGK